ncbi:MAG: MOSC domain-containing protein [Bradyrhizobiaceae bacterium]|nr:MOSC domain-containing protein [Bradyrhizobiaceae bacterium]
MPAEAGPARIASLYRYPVKGLSGERLDKVSLTPGGTFPMDRAFALENGPSGFDPTAPAWQPKIKFLCLMKNARIASLHTHYDDATGTFAIAKNGETLVQARLNDASGRTAVEQFFQEFMGSEARGKIRLLEAPGHSFSDVAKKVVSIINLDSVAALGDSVKRPVHPLRFRGNIYLEGWPAWSEAALVDRTLEIGAVRLRVIKPIQRCAATEVDPNTAERDIDVPDALYRLTGEDDCGIYAEVLTPGNIAEGNPVTLSR